MKHLPRAGYQNTIQNPMSGGRGDIHSRPCAGETSPGPRLFDVYDVRGHGRICGPDVLEQVRRAVRLRVKRSR
ncbi:MAG: hypothetical protein M3Z23_10480 [Acidobacteriota bacterium]|nr:hypothetical protein [Acidobacteriota bacterium]